MATFSKGKNGELILDVHLELKPRDAKHAEAFERIARKFAGNKQLEHQLAAVIAPVINWLVQRELGAAVTTSWKKPALEVVRPPSPAIVELPELVNPLTAKCRCGHELEEHKLEPYDGDGQRSGPCGYWYAGDDAEPCECNGFVPAGGGSP